MNIIVYFLQVSACTGIFYLFYYLFLRRLTFFTINRWYLLTTILLSFAIPAIKLPIVPQHQYIPVVQQVIYINTLQSLPQVVTPTIKTAVIATPVFSWLLLAKAVYLITVITLACRLLISIILLLNRLSRQKGLKVNNAVILKCDKKLANGSFLNYIFLDDGNLSDVEQQQVIAHEMLHVKLNHSADRILLKLAQIILWFNPFVYLCANAVEENHEFEVDREMALSTNKNNYANLLLSLAVNGHNMLCNNFSKAPLKTRIKMLFTKPSNNMKKSVYLLIIPLVLLSCLAFARLQHIHAKKTSIAARQAVRYRQNVKLREDELHERAKFEAYQKTDDYKNKSKALNDISGKELNVVIKDVIKDRNTDKTTGFLINYNNNDFELRSFYGQEKQLNNLLNKGDKVSMKVFSCSFGENQPIAISPAYVYKDGAKIFQLAEGDKIPAYPFLYERNKVRFADGQVTNIEKYPGGKWKSAVFETVNGYKFNLSFKPTAPDFSAMESGDHVRLRFVHELQKGNKEYLVNDWVSISANEKDYGIKNPDLFYKFYTAI